MLDDPPSGETKHGVNGPAHPLELLLFGYELLPPGGSEAIVSRATIVVGKSPLRLDITVQEQTLEAGIQRALADLEDVVGDATETLGDAVAVQRPALERAKDEEI